MKKSVNKYQIWDGFYSYSLPEVEYIVCGYEQNDKGVILTYSELSFIKSDGFCTFEIEFNGEIAYIRDVPELKRWDTTGDLLAEFKEFLKHYEIIFVVKNSSLVSELKLNPEVFIHFCLIDDTALIDIITDKEPIIRRLSDNE
jgi:hypothetical protein